MASTGGRFWLKGLSKRGQYIRFLSVASPLKALGDGAANKWILTQQHRIGPGKPLWGESGPSQACSSQVDTQTH